MIQIQFAMHTRKSWNKVNEQNSSHSSSQCQDSRQETFSAKKSSQKVVSIHFDEAKSPKMNKRQQDLRKLNNIKDNDVWLFIQNNSIENENEIEHILNKLPDLKRLSTNPKGWNAKFSVKDAYKYIAEGVKYTDTNQREIFLQFCVSIRNQSEISSPRKKANFVPKVSNINFVEKEKVDQFKSYREKPQRSNMPKKGSTVQDLSSYESFSPRTKKHYEEKKEKIKKYMPKSPDQKNY